MLQETSHTITIAKSHPKTTLLFGAIGLHLHVYVIILGEIENYVLRLLPQGDLWLLQYFNYSLILSMIDSFK